MNKDIYIHLTFRTILLIDLLIRSLFICFTAVFSDYLIYLTVHDFI